MKRTEQAFRGWMLCMFLCIAVHMAAGQDALVTFYSHGSQLTSGMPGGNDIFSGIILDGSQKLFRFHDGHFLHNNRFLTLRFTPGQHIFAASYGVKPKPSETLSMELKSGKRYLIWAGGNTKGVPTIFTVSYGRLELVNCTEAQPDMEKARPLKDEALLKSTRAQVTTMLVVETGPPDCDLPGFKQ